MQNPNDILLAVLMLLGGVGLFLFGMDCLVRMFKDAAGPAMRRAMKRVDGRQWTGWLTGAGASALIHSAPAVVIIMGLVSAGLLRFSTTMGMIAGANFGTTLAIQVIAFDIGRYALGLVGAGMLLRIVRGSGLGGHIALGLVGFGLIFLGLNTLKTSMAPFQESEWLLGAMRMLGSESPLGIPLGILLGFGITVALQSSGAAISILFSLAAVGLLPGLGAMIPMLLGIQLGKCAPTVFAVAGNTLGSLQVAIAHLAFNGVAIVAGILTLPLAEALIPMTSADPIRQIANYNTALMLATGLLVVPFANPAARAIERATGKSKRPRTTPSHLDPDLVPYPERALAACVQELRRQGRYTRQMLDNALDGLVSLDKRPFAVNPRLEESIEAIRLEVEAYIELVGARRLSPRQVLMLQHVARMANSLKRIGDHIQSLAVLSRQKFRERIWFSDHDMQQLLDLSYRASTMLTETLDSLDPDLDEAAAAAKDILEKRNDYRRASRAVRGDFNGRLPEDGGEGRTALMYIHFVTLFDKIVSHLKEIARQERSWSWRLKDHKLERREPPAPPPPTIPRGAVVDPDYRTAVRRVLHRGEGGVVRKPSSG